MTQENSPPIDFLPSLQTSVLRNSPFADYIRFSEFKRLLGKIVTSVENEKVKSIAVLSAKPQEGKTFLVAAMALGYAVLLQKRVLIVNTVLKSGTDSLELKKVYENELQRPPAQVSGSTPFSQMIDLISPQTEGKESSQSDMVDFMLGKFVDKFKRDYDLIILDTCALNSTDQRMIDPVVIAGQADSSILVTSELSLNRESITSVKTMLAQWQVRTLGVVHNGAKPKAGGRK